MITIISLWEPRAPLPQWRFPSTFTQVLRRLTRWWYCSPLKLQIHFCNKSGEGILEVGRAERGMLPLKPQGCWRCWIPVFAGSILPGILFARLNAQERSQETCKHLLTLPRNSFRALAYLTVPEPTLVFCHKQYQVKYVPSSTTLTNVKQNFLWSCIHFMEAACLHLRNPEQSKNTISKLNEGVIAHIWQVFCNCVKCQLWKPKVLLSEQDYAWAWLVKCWIWCSWRSFPTYVIL